MLNPLIKTGTITESPANIQGRQGGGGAREKERERRANQVQVCLITHIKVDGGNLKNQSRVLSSRKGVRWNVHRSGWSRGASCARFFSTQVHAHTHRDPTCTGPTLARFTLLTLTHTHTHALADWETLMLVHTTAETRPLGAPTSTPNWQLCLMPVVSKHFRVVDCTLGL